jgi:hypothetical protein
MIGVTGLETDFKALETMGEKKIKDDTMFNTHFTKIEELLKYVYPEIEQCLKLLRTNEL